MEEIIVYGGANRLKGSVEIEGAKNSVLSIIAASLLGEEGVTVLNNVPPIKDVLVMVQILKQLNAKVDFNQEKKQIKIDASEHLNNEASYELVIKIRASILIMGPLLVRNGGVNMALPGGCSIGNRPIELHLKGFQALGAEASNSHSYIQANAKSNLTGGRIYLDVPSVGATQNIMMAAVKAKGTTIINNAAKEPEIIELAIFLNKMGANIAGAGSENIVIEGINRLHAAEHCIIQDRLEAGTFMIAAAITEGNIVIKDAIASHHLSLIAKLIEAGAIVSEEESGIRVIGPKVIKPTVVKTLPYPGFSTDMQAPMIALQMIASGSSVLTETVYEDRFQYLKEIRKMNGNVNVRGNSVFINGSQLIQGATVAATDLRAAAALILLGLRASGQTIVRNLEHLDRGYYKFHEKLKKLGATIERVNSSY